MISKLKIQNFVLIQDIEINCASPFIVITGETGAGKSILIKALQFMLGQKFSPDYIRPDADFALIEITLQTKDVPIVYKRILERKGSSKSYINNKKATLTALLESIRSHIQIHGQYAQHSLFQKDVHEDFVNRLLGDKYCFSSLEQTYNSWKTLEKEIAQLKSKWRKNIELKEDWQNQLNDLNTLNPQENEVDILSEKKQNIKNQDLFREEYERLIKLFSFDSGFNSDIGKCLNRIERLQEISPFDQIYSALDKIKIEAEEILYIAEKQAQSEFFHEDKNTIEERLSELKSMARKFKCQPELLHELHIKTKNNLEELDHLQAQIRQLEKEAEKKKEVYIQTSKQLVKVRETISKIICEDFTKEFKDLKLENANIKIVQNEKPENLWNEKGTTSVEFLLQTNPGMPHSSIENSASGGELSRILLALSCILQKYHHSNTIIFDEIDSGMSGPLCALIGKKLMALSKNQQVLCITHSPQIAGRGCDHLYVRKETINNEDTKVSFSYLNKSNRIKEIARMLSDDKLTKETLAAAEKMYQIEKNYIHQTAGKEDEFVKERKSA